MEDTCHFFCLGGAQSGDQQDCYMRPTEIIRMLTKPPTCRDRVLGNLCRLVDACLSLVGVFHSSILCRKVVSKFNYDNPNLTELHAANWESYEGAGETVELNGASSIGIGIDAWKRFCCYQPRLFLSTWWRKER